MAIDSDIDINDELQRTFNALTDRLREEISRQVGQATRDLAVALEHERAAVATEAVRDADARLSAGIATAEARALEAGREEGRALGRAEGLLDGHREGRDAARADFGALTRAADERLADAIRLMDRAPWLSDVLDALASSASREAARVGVLLVVGEGLRAWRFIGFGPTLDGASRLDVSMDDGGIVADAARTGLIARGNADHGSGGAAPVFAALESGREMLAVPVAVGGRVVAVLYADQDLQDRDVSVEADLRGGWPAALDVLARHAARCLETITALRTAQMLPSLHGANHTGAVDPGTLADNRSDEEQAARRYARLLVSEIKLYHEADVAAGCRERDLTTRLGGAIARARVLYEQHVPELSRQTGDYFHSELVRTLANGDASLIESSGGAAAALEDHSSTGTGPPIEG